MIGYVYSGLPEVPSNVPILLMIGFGVSPGRQRWLGLRCESGLSAAETPTRKVKHTTTLYRPRASTGSSCTTANSPSTEPVNPDPRRPLTTAKPGSSRGTRIILASRLSLPCHPSCQRTTVYPLAFSNKKPPSYIRQPIYDRLIRNISLNDEPTRNDISQPSKGMPAGDSPLTTRFP